MPTIDKVNQHIGLHLQANIRDICQPLLEHFNIDYFHYFRTYNNGGCISLSTHPDFIEHRFKKKFQNGVLVAPNDRADVTYTLWDLIDKNKTDIFIEAQQHFSIQHGITFIKKIEDCFEFVHYGVTIDDPYINHFYINQSQLLLDFIGFFKDRGQKLIAKCEADKITVPRSNEKNLYIDKNPYLDNDRIQSFREQIQNHGVIVDKDNEHLKLSSREYNIAKKYLQGYSAKMTAKELFISHRTVEKVISNVYLKLKCENKYEMFDIFFKNNLL